MLLIVMMIFAPLSLWAQMADAPASADTDKVVPDGCRDFTAEQMKDPNSPCFAEVRADLDPRKTEGDYFEPNVSTASTMDECNGCHVLTDIDVTANTNENIYNVKFLKNAVPQYGSPAEETGGDEKSGTD